MRLLATALIALFGVAQGCVRFGAETPDGDSDIVDDSDTTDDGDSGPPIDCSVDFDRDHDGYRAVECGGDDCNDDPNDCGAFCHPGAIQLCQTPDDASIQPVDSDCNSDTVPCATVPQISELTDDFSGSGPGTFMFGYYETLLTTIARADGVLHITLNKDDSGSYAGYYSHYVFSLKNDSLAVQIIQVPDLATEGAVTAYVLLHDPVGGSSMDFNFSADAILLRTNTATIVGQQTYDASTMAWARLREASNIVYLDTSADGKTWTEVASHAAIFDMSQVVVTVGAGIYETNTYFDDTATTPGSFKIDNLNLLPP